MIGVVRKILIQIIFKIFPLDFVLQHIEEQKAKRNRLLVTISGESKFGPTASVHNFQSDISKIKIGRGAFVRGELLIYPSGGEIKIGDNCYIGENSRIWSANKVEIGDNVLISFNVTISDTDAHEMDAVERASGYRKIFIQGHPATTTIPNEPIVVGDNAWINLNSVILKGVTIGEGAIVAAGSIVTENVAPYTLVAGNPARLIKNLK